MRMLSAFVAGALLLGAPAAAQSVQYHAAEYLIGGYYSTSSLYLRGVNILDLTGTAPTVRPLVRMDYWTYGFCMDGDNRQVLLAVGGTTSSRYGPKRNGLFRYDPATGTLQTIWQDPPSGSRYTAVYHVVVDYNGDYIVNVYRFQSSPFRADYYLWKIDASGNVTTIATTAQLGRRGVWNGKTTWNIDTGKLLVSDSGNQVSPTTMRYPVLEVDTARGTIGTFSAGRQYGWYGFYSMPQNHGNGYIEGAYYRYLYQLRPGAASRTTLFSLHTPPYFYGGGAFDLQTAARPRMVYAYYSFSPYSGVVMYVDRATGTVTTIRHSPGLRCYNYDFAFYRGRHTQTFRAANRIWQVLFSAPRFAGKPYVAVLGISGVRPGIRLPSGRRIHLYPDVVTFLTVKNQLPIWKPGPGKLDANGEAVGLLDLSAYQPAGIPLWIQWLILDPKAPEGIAYIPDVYVMRI